MWIREHQRPWTLGAIVAADAAALKRSLLDALAARSFRRAWLVVGGDRGWWREERLCLRRGANQWSFALDAADGAREPRAPAHPELIPTLEVRAREVIERDGIVEGTLRTARPGRAGLLLIGCDVDARTLYGLAGYRELLELYWRIRFEGRLARGTAPG